MRGVLDDLESPHPIGMRLPGLYAEDGMAQRLTAALDEVLAPVFATLDCLPAYLDPRVAPDDFVDWLAGWVGLVADDTWTATRRRELVARAAGMHPWRGTRRGLAEHVRLVVGGPGRDVSVEVIDGGGAAWSATPGAAPPGTGRREVRVRVRAPDPRTVDRPGLEALVALLVPAHLVPVVEVLPIPDVPLPRRPGAPTDPPPGRPVPPGAGHRHDGPGDAGQPGPGA